MDAGSWPSESDFSEQSWQRSTGAELTAITGGPSGPVLCPPRGGQPRVERPRLYPADRALGAAAIAVNSAPDALGRCRHFDMGYAELGERIDDRVDDHAERGCRPALASRADAQWVRRRGDFTELGREERQSVGTQHRVVQQRARQQLPGIPVVDTVFTHRLADPMSDAAMDLAMHDHRIDGAPDIVDGSITRNRDDTGVGAY